jgi:VWFA-related protein
VVYVDNENIRPHDRNRVLSQARQFVREVMQPHVQVMVVSALRSATIVQPFTNDAKAVQDALRSMNRDYGARVDQDRQRSRIIHDIQKQVTESQTGSKRQRQAAALELENQIRTYAEELAMELDYSIGTLREVLTTLSGLPGRKVLLHVSNGLPAVPGRDLIDWYGDLYQKSSSLPMLARFNRRFVFDSLASSANAQGIRFYTVDATGLGGDASASAEYSQPIDPMFAGIHQINYQEPLLYLAERTGGRALVGANNITGLLEDLRGDLFTYYSLGYTLPSSGADTVHRIEVELPEHPEYEIVYRQTLVEKSLETQVQDRVISGLMLGLDHNPMDIELSAGAREATAAGDRWLLPVAIRLPIQSVAMLPENDEYVGRVVVFIANRDLKGRQSDMQRREFEIRMPVADYENRSRESYAADFDLLLNPGNHRIVIGVLDPVTRQTSFASIEQSFSAKQ